MCRDVFTVTQREKIKTSLNLLTELEECDKISEGNVIFLINLLEFEGKSKLVSALKNYAANEQESLPFPLEEYSQHQPAQNSQGKYYLILYI